MYSEERGIFKPSLKTHAMTNDVSIKRFSFTEHSQRQENIQYNSNQERINNQPFSYPSLQQSISAFTKDFNKDQAKQTQKQIKYPSLIIQSQSDLTATKFDPILPKILFKRFISNQQVPIIQSKRQNSQIIQELKVRNINYPVEVQKLTKQAEDKKTQYFRKFLMKQTFLQTQKNWRQNSYRQSVSQHISTGLRKMPYFPLMGTDGKIFWSHSADKLVLWKYRNSQIHNPDVFCILNFEQQSAPLTAVYATNVMSPLFKNKNIILIAVAFFNQMQFYSFDIEKYETQFLKKIPTSEQNEDIFKKYVQKILVKVNSNFFIEKILIQNIQSFERQNYQNNPLILFTDGSRDLQIVDLSNLSAFKTHSQYNFCVKRQKIKLNKNQNEIIKLLHCRDQICPQIHYAFVLRKQTSMNEIKPTSLIQKIKNFLTFTKKYQKSQQMILSIYQWNQKELKNQTLWKKIWNPPRVKKIKEVSSKDLQLRLKQNFFQFFRLNANSQFFISDISLVQKQKSFSIFQNYQSSSCFLKVTFINGTSVMISNFKTLTFVSKAMVNPYIENSVPILSCQYKNYRSILQKGHYLQSQKEIKNKFNLYIYEPIDIEKDVKYSSIDPVLSESDGLMICEQKLMYQDDQQIAYKFQDCNSRKRISEVKLNVMGQKKRFMIFQNSFITLVETPNVAQSLLVLGHLLERHSSGKEKIQSYVKSLIEDMSENSRVSFLKSIIQMLILIINSGKKTQSNSPNRMILQDIVRDFYGKDKRLDIDDTTYVEDKDSYKTLTEQIYEYECEINKEGYQNFVEYLFSSEIAKKQKQFLKETNSSYNGKNFQLKVTQNTVNFIFEILIEQSLIVIPPRPIVKPFKSTSVNLFQEKFNMNQETYLRNLLEGMNEVNESYMVAAVSKFIVDLIRPLIYLPYQSFHHIKPNSTKILQILDLLHNFINKFVRFSSFKNYQSTSFTETVLLMKSLQNSLPKFSLLLRLFNALSEVYFYNQSSVNTNHKSHLNTDLKSKLTLVNFLFKLNQKQFLSQMAVEKLFEENSVFLDEIQSKLPQLNEIKYLRYLKGWKKINQKILAGNISQKNKNKPVESSWVFGLFNLPNKDKSSKLISPLLPFENEQRSLQEANLRKKEEFLQIEKALNEYSFEDFQKYFLNKNQFLNFTQIVLSKINYLQIIYLQLKNKYHFQDGIYETFPSFTSNLIQKTVTPTLAHHHINKFNQTVQKFQLSSFLKYEQKIYNHQKYLKTYQLIKFLNSGLSTFIDKAFLIYSQQTQKSVKQLLPIVNSNNIKTPTFIQPNHYQAPHQNDFVYFLGQQMQKVVDLLMEKGSQFIRNQLHKKLKNSPSFQIFLTKHKNLLKQRSEKSQQFAEYYDHKNYLVKDQPKPLTLQEKQQAIFENERKKMYLQKIEQKITIESREPYKIQNDMNWMQRHNKNSSLNLNNQNF